MVRRSAMSDLRRELRDEVGVRPRIDLALEELRGRAHGELRHFLAQAVPRALRFEIDLLLGRGDQPLPFLRRGGLRLLDELVRTMLRVIDDLRGAFACLADDRIRALVRLRQLLLALFGGGEPERNALRAL